MRYLLDTNAISETLKKNPDRNVAQWFDQTPSSLCALSVITIGEIRSGVERMPASAARERNRYWLERTLPEMFDGRILPVTGDIAGRWGRICASFSRTLPTVDSLLVATALTHGLTLVTRDADFVGVSGLEIFNPWTIN